MATVRSAFALAITIALLLGACGGGDSSSTTTPAGTSKGSTGSTTKGGPTKGSRAERQKARAEARARRLAQRGNYKASANIFYLKGRLRCSTVPIGILASLYQARSEDPREVASAYATRAAPVPSYYRAAADGCLAGIKKRQSK
jgi:hypothetical protein